MERYFVGSKDEVSYGSVRLQPLSYQDDICRLAGCSESARAGNVKLSGLMDEKGLKCHPGKTVLIAIGTKKFREEVNKEIKQNPIMFGDFQVKSKEEDVYLGDVISARGLEASIEATIRKRSGKVKGEMFKVKAIMSDFRMQAVGGMAGAWDLWESAILPSLLNNCSSWIGATKKTTNLLNEYQNMYLRMIYSCPPSSPLISLRTQAGMPDMLQRVWLEQVCMVSRLLHTNKEQENVARDVLQEQLLQGWPGLCQEVQQICLTVGLPDVTKEDIHRKEALGVMEYYSMKIAKEQMSGKEKCRHIGVIPCQKSEKNMTDFFVGF